ncbi:MAG: hypothetical protein JWM98_2399 [Thermoleophilia bacterium]|nr:hypothetical protein [Thermoleophilia bacterium]
MERWRPISCLLLGAVLALGAVAGAPGATSGTVVSASVPTATTVSTSGCLPGAPGITALGVVLPGSRAVSTSDCVVTWGASNGTSTLRVAQEDGSGVAMHRNPDGVLDAAFGTGGRRSWDPGPNSYTYDSAVGPAGTTYLAGERCGNCDPIVTRIAADGSLDPAWGTGGFRAFTEGSGFDGVFAAVAPDADGSVLAAGYQYGAGFLRDMLIVRFTSTGALDTSFDGDGILRPWVLGGDDIYYDLAIQPDGRILAAGRNGNDDIVVDRFSASGMVDSSWGTAGRVTLSYAGAGTNEGGKRIELQPNGAVVVETVTDGGATDTARLVRLTSTGTVDGSFALQAWSIDDAIFWDQVGLAVQPDGKVLTATGSPGARMRVARHLASGGPDPAFGSAGVATVSFGGAAPDRGESLALEGDGAIYVAGHTANRGGVGVARLTPAGALDGAFGTAGLRSLPSTPGVDVEPVALVHMADGRLLATLAENADYVGYAFAAPGISDYGGAATWASGSSLFAACLAGTTGAGVVATWTPGAACPATDGPAWRAVPSTPSAVANTTSALAGATASFRFGMQSGLALAPGGYQARISFEVIAP